MSQGWNPIESRLDEGAEIMACTKLTDINIECQAHIFKYLDFIDLLNIADTSKQLKTPSEVAFAKKYGNEEVAVKTIHSNRSQNKIGKEEIGWIKFAKTCLQLFRNFGHLVFVLNFEPFDLFEGIPLFATLYRRAIISMNECCAE